MAKRLKVTHKGDRLWNVGVFLGKTESDSWLIGQPDGVHCVRSVRPLAEKFDAERISNLSTHTWEIKQTLLGTRVLPHKHRTQPSLAALPPVNAEEQQQLENNDEAATDPDSDESQHSAGTHSSGKLGSEAILAELEESIDDLQQEPPSPTATSPVPAAAAASAAPPIATAMELRSDGPVFEEVGSPSKIPRYRAPLPRAHPGATANISRAEVLPHDDEVIDEYDEDTESLYPNSDDDYVEQDEVYKEEASHREQQQLPAKFFQEELGPPDIEEESLQALDDQATIKEITRLTKMEVVELINIEGQEDDESKYLTTKLVLDWRFRDADGFQLEEGADSKAVSIERCWQRRSRLVAREYKTVEKRDDVFSPATSPALTKIIPMLCLAYNWSIWSVDVKDAFLQVPQKVKVLCRIPSEAEAIVARMMEVPVDSLKHFRWKLKRVLPGQRDAALLWSYFCDDLLKSEGLERSTANPALYRLIVIIDGRKVIRAVCIVHVDDLQFAGIIEVVVPLLERLQKKVKLQVEGPFLTPEEKEAGYSLQHVRFLKRKFTYEDHELRISIDPKYVKKLSEVLQLDKKQPRKFKQTPCTSSSSEPDHSPTLPTAEAATYRSAVGMLLYVAHDRPDIQFSVRSLSCGMKEPTEKKFKELQHLALYMKGTADYVAVFKKTKKGQSVLSTSSLSSSPGGVPEEEEQQEPGEHLLEVFSDSDWAGDKESRRSVSCACMFLDGNYFFSYSRTQKSIALSSAEAEYLSLTGTASEALNIHTALRFLTASPVVLKAFTDSSACRGICARQGVGRIKHLAVRLLWLQQAIRAGRLTVHSVPTQQNPADIGTKPLTAKRIQLLLYILNFRNDDQRIGEEEYRQYSAAAVIRRLEKSFSRKGFFTAAVFAALTQRSEGMRHTLSKQETCKGAAAAMAESTTLKQASCSITVDFGHPIQHATHHG